MMNIKLISNKLLLTIVLTLGLICSVQAQFESVLQLSNVNGNNGFVINGVGAGDRSGYSVSSAGDINGDNIDDILIGAYRANASGNSQAGRVYIVYGSSAGFANPLNLANINGTNGFVINGENVDDFSGISVSSAGDINGDTIADIIIGATGSDPNGNSLAGRSYVVFGNNSGLPNPLNLSDINGTNGFIINGNNTDDSSGVSVSSAGDVNGDGIDDILIGANRANVGGNMQAGRSYVVFGRTTGFPNTLNLSSINGTNGFVIRGVSSGDWSGYSVSSAGDVNNDGIDDILIGAYLADPNGNGEAGRSYVVFGRTTAFPNPLNLSSLGATSGFVMEGENTNDRSGISVSSAGDVNGDGVGDILVGASFFDPNSNMNAGRTYVIFGRTSAFPSLLSLSNISGTSGFVINGAIPGGTSGASVSSAGDVNGDGVDDILIGANRAASNGASDAGLSYVVFGSRSGFVNQFNLADINGVNGFVINGQSTGDRSGTSVSPAGDVNADGVDDILIGAYRADPNGSQEAGRSYVIFGIDRMFKNGFEN